MTTSASALPALPHTAGTRSITERVNVLIRNYNGATTGGSTPGTSVTFLQSGTGAVSQTVTAKLQNTVHVKDFGAVGDGTTDDTAKVQSAIDAVNSRGGGTVDCTGGRWLINSANLNIKSGVFLVGPWSNMGRPPTSAGNFDYSTVESAFILNPSFTINPVARDYGIQGMAILRKGLTTPTTIRQCVDLVTAFSGTAITVGDGSAQTANDGWLSNLFIAGFAVAISSNFNDRLRMEYISGDNTAGIYITKSFDMQHLSHVHFWPFLTAATTPVAYAVSGAVNNGSGLVRLTIASSVLQTGDRVLVNGVGGATGASGPFIATVNSPTSIDLQGSTFGGVYTSGGTVTLSAWYRSGVGINFDTQVDWGQMDTCFCYNYATGIKINSCDQTTLINSGADAYSGVPADTAPIGIWVTGTSAATALVGCKTAAQGVGLKCDSTASARNTVNVTNHRGWGNVTYAYQVSNGWASFVNCEAKTSQVVRIDDAATGAYFVGGDLTGATFSYQSSASPLATFIGTRGQLAIDVVGNAASGSTQIAKFEGHNSTPTANDTIFKSYLLTNASNAQVEVVRESYRATAVTAGAMTSQLFWALSNAGTFANCLQMTPTFLGPIAAGGMALGAAAQAWASLTTTAAINSTSGTVQYMGTAGGTADALTATPTVPVLAYATGAFYLVKAASNNATTTPTIAISGLAAKTIVKRTSTALAAADILSGMMLHLVYDGTNMQLLNPVVN